MRQKQTNFLVGPNGTDRAVLPIFETKDYNQFKSLSTNRRLSSSNLNRLKASFKAYPGIVIPIWANDNMEVIDGNHRLQIAKELELPLYFYVKEGGIIQARIMNTFTAKWKNEDFHHSHVQENNPTYVLLDKLYKEYESLSRRIIDIVATGLARGERQINLDESGFRLSSRSKILGDAFEIKPEDKLRELLSKLWDYNSSVKMTGKLAKVLSELFDTESFDHDYFLQKVKAAQISPSSYAGIVLKNGKSGLLVFPDTTKDIRDSIEKLYNKAKTKKVKLF